MKDVIDFQKYDVIASGAEASLYFDSENNILFKNRLPKLYRIEEIDQPLRKSRTKREIKVLQDAKMLGINVPSVYNVNDPFVVSMDFIPGEKLRDVLLNDPNKKDLLIGVGEMLSILHDNDIIHGDLTTSNMILKKETNDVYLIDFGLSFASTKIEDKAVDIHLLKQAFESTHYMHADIFFELFLKGYSNTTNFEDVMKRYDEVVLRGRNKH